MNAEEYMKGMANGTLPRYDAAGTMIRETICPSMTEMQGDQPVRRVPRFSGVERAVHNSPPPLDDVGSDVSYMLDENDPDAPQPPPAYHLLTRAAEIVAGDRHAQHGPKERNFSNIAILWRAYISLKYANEGEDSLFELTAFDVATMMELLKIGRRFSGSGRTNPDNYIDGSGYSAIAGEIAMNGPLTGTFPHKRKPGENPSS